MCRCGSTAHIVGHTERSCKDKHRCKILRCVIARFNVSYTQRRARVVTEQLLLHVQHELPCIGVSPRREDVLLLLPAAVEQKPTCQGVVEENLDESEETLLVVPKDLR